ncbi:serine hydrolase domain-containing protein [Ensifer sp. 2YAB10]|uniref:serine hydrolase domain-containing protein n=1 Tax=unclassified Ensifer TaxID=2633371 RepID=UPI001A492C80|nr:serine hydrolase domain-containing protein [Ensifer sp. SSB1]MBK5571010.1 beta-lactamase family protein [Ensifer sp. SSB1]
MSLHLKEAALLALLLASPALAEDQNASLGARLDPVIDQAIADKRIVGAVILVARDGELVYARAAGLADREAGRAMKEDDIFRFASVTKPFVTAAAMRLVEEGRITLDDPVSKWLSDFKPTFDGKPATILVRHLLNHTAGLEYGFFQPPGGLYAKAGVSDGLDLTNISLDENLKRLASVPLASEPGKTFRYSLAIDVLGSVIEKATGKTLDKAVNELVVAPLSLADAGFSSKPSERLTAAYFDASPAPKRMEGSVAVPIGEGKLTFSPGRILDAKQFPSGGAGMAGTAKDVLTFLEAIRKGGSPILSAETVKKMTQDQTGAEAQTQGPGWGFGYGWAVLVDPKAGATPQSKGTIQWGGAYGHNWFVDPVEKITVVAMTNTTFEGMWGPFTRDVRDAVYGKR